MKVLKRKEVTNYGIKKMDSGLSMLWKSRNKGLVLADQVMHHQVFLALVRVVRMASISQNGKKNN